jgi:hypothetical protein
MILPHIRIIGLWRGARLEKLISGWLVRTASIETMADYFQSEHSLGCFQIQNATRSSPNGLRFVEGRAR